MNEIALDEMERKKEQENVVTHEKRSPKRRMAEVVVYGLFTWCLTIATLGSFGLVVNIDFALWVVGGAAVAAFLAFIAVMISAEAGYY